MSLYVTHFGRASNTHLSGHSENRRVHPPFCSGAPVIDRQQTIAKQGASQRRTGSPGRPSRNQTDRHPQVLPDMAISKFVDSIRAGSMLGCGPVIRDQRRGCANFRGCRDFEWQSGRTRERNPAPQGLVPDYRRSDSQSTSALSKPGSGVPLAVPVLYRRRDSHSRSHSQWHPNLNQTTTKH